MALADLLIPLMSRSPIWASFPYCLWDLQHPSAGHKKQEVVSFFFFLIKTWNASPTKKHTAFFTKATMSHSGCRVSSTSRQNGTGGGKPWGLLLHGRQGTCTDHISSGPCLHYGIEITSILMDPLGKRYHFNTCVKESRTGVYLSPVFLGLDICLTALGHSHICAQINTRLRCQISLLKRTTSDKRTAENRKFVWWKPKDWCSKTLGTRI